MSRTLATIVLSVSLLGCSGGPPRKPIPPDQREGTHGMQRERFEVRGIRDEKLDGITLCDGLMRMGGVESCKRDESTGKFIVVFNGERVTRDQIHARIVELGDEEGRTWDPIFDDR
jgi:hypothetical protein